MMASIQKHRSKANTKRKAETPQEFVEDCKILAIDFDKLKVKVDKIFDKWTQKGYEEKKIGKWIRPLMKEAGYSRVTIWSVLPAGARQKQNHTRGKGLKNLTLSDESSESQSHKSTFEDEVAQEDDVLESTYGIFEIKPESYMLQDLDKYTSKMKNKIIIYLDKQTTKLNQEIATLKQKLQHYEDKKQNTTTIHKPQKVSKSLENMANSMFAEGLAIHHKMKKEKEQQKQQQHQQSQKQDKEEGR